MRVNLSGRELKKQEIHTGGIGDDTLSSVGFPAAGSGVNHYLAIVSATNPANCFTSFSVVSNEHIQRTSDFSSSHT
jgi:hypothetical protein